jgi:hypothetical protein
MLESATEPYLELEWNLLKRALWEFNLTVYVHNPTQRNLHMLNLTMELVNVTYVDGTTETLRRVKVIAENTTIPPVKSLYVRESAEGPKHPYSLTIAILGFFDEPVMTLALEEVLVSGAPRSPVMVSVHDNFRLLSQSNGNVTITFEFSNLGPDDFEDNVTTVFQVFGQLASGFSAVLTKGFNSSPIIQTNSSQSVTYSFVAFIPARQVRRLSLSYVSTDLFEGNRVTPKLEISSIRGMTITDNIVTMEFPMHSPDCGILSWLFRLSDPKCSPPPTETTLGQQYYILKWTKPSGEFEIPGPGTMYDIEVIYSYEVDTMPIIGPLVTLLAGVMTDEAVRRLRRSGKKSRNDD